MNYKKYYEDGTLIYEEEFQNNMRNGKRKLLYCNGNYYDVEIRYNIICTKNNVYNKNIKKFKII
jgi:antitoxin component YwqK of YwqJK toxin-antitoxin module